MNSKGGGGGGVKNNNLEYNYNEYSDTCKLD
jgi:hypothetical protein